MRVSRPLVSLLALVLLTMPAFPVHATGGSGVVDYYAAGSPILVWCAQPHERTYVPDGTPDEHDPLGWPLSGEPECLPPDLMSDDDRDVGVGGGAFCVLGTWNGVSCGDHQEHEMTVTGQDLAGEPHLFVDASYCETESCRDAVASGCGSVTLTLLPFESHWQGEWDPDRPRLVWVRVDAVHMEPDTHELCIGSQGTLDATY